MTAVAAAGSSQHGYARQLRSELKMFSAGWSAPLGNVMTMARGPASSGNCTL